MTVKHILIPTMGVKSSGAALGTSLLLAKLFGAHAEVLFIKEDPEPVNDFETPTVSIY